MSLAHFMRDERYGRGAYRRRVRFTQGAGGLVSTLDDTHHAMWLHLKHDARHIVGVDAGIERGPATSCGGAPAALRAVIGLPIIASPAEIASRLPPALHCTHLADLLRWSINRSRQAAFRSMVYEVKVPDSVGVPITIEICRDGAVIHQWLIDGDTIRNPPELAGLPLLRGFMAWARTKFDGGDLEAAIMLQRGVWVARGRRYIVDRERVPLRAAGGMENACYSYSGVNWQTATSNLDYVRDFSDRVVEHPLPAHIQESI